MALISRISRLFSADIHAVLDRIEEPELLLRQAIREMEEELQSSECRIRMIQQEQAQIGAREEDAEHSVQRLDDDLDLCLESGKDELARKLVGRKLEARALLKQLGAQYASNQRLLSDLGAVVTGNREQLQSMRQKAELFLRGEDAERCLTAYPGIATPESRISDDEIDVALLWEKQKRGQS
jgi:phage shock protein A